VGRPAAAVVPLVLWNPTTDSEWAFSGNLDDRTGRPHTLDELFGFVLRSWYSKPEFSPKVRWTVEHVRRLCREARLPEQPEVGNIIGWVEWLRCQGYEPGTVNLYWRALRTVFELGAKAGYSRGNPAWPLALAKPKGKPHHIRDIGEQWPKMMAACVTARERAFVAVQRLAGVRRSEALGLKAGDLLNGVEGAELLIRRQRPAPNGWATKATKGKRARNVPVHPELEAMLREVIAEGPARVKVGRGGQRVIESEFLFPFREQDLHALGERLREVAPEAFPRGRKMWHALRDTFAIEMYENGADISVLRDWLGHSTETVTHENYIGDVAARVSRATLRFVGASSPPQVKAAALGAETPNVAARVGMVSAETPTTPERSTQSLNSAAKEATCSTQPRSVNEPRPATVQTVPASRTRRRAPGSPVPPAQRALPRLALQRVTTKPERS
jgi:integrase